MAKRWKLEYQCRRCGKRLVTTNHALPSDANTALDTIMVGNCKTFTYLIDDCDDGHLGVADFVGIQIDQENT